MSLLALAGVSYAYSPGTPLFEDVSFSINPADRIAVVGPNGAGKSTLLRVLAGELEPVSGETVRRSPLRLAVAEQTPAADAPATLFDFVFAAHATLDPLRRRLCELGCDLERDLGRDLGRDGVDPQHACEYATCICEYEEHGGYAAEAAVARILGGLGYPERDFGRRIETLSGGERTRATLARALAMDSDLLILDEPTNHLDIDAREWLEEHLRNRQAATVLTSHDRTLLAAFATRVVEIERGRWRIFEGGFDVYRAARALLDRQAREAYDAFERRRAIAERAAERRSQLARRVAATPEGGAGVRNPFYSHKAAKVARTARLLRERVSDEEPVQKPWEETPIDGLTFDTVPRGGDIVLTVQGLTKAYAERSLFRGLSFTVRRGERLVVRGANGTGKSTLLKIIQGRVEPDAGTVALGAQIRLASVDQVPEDLDLALTPLELCGTGTRARTLLGCLKLRPDRLNRPLRELSGGERTKVALARVLDSGANLLLLDEPTNHLEIEAQEALEQALERYPGTLILVSHDRSFLAGLGPQASYLDLG